MLCSIAIMNANDVDEERCNDSLLNNYFAMRH